MNAEPRSHGVAHEVIELERAALVRWLNGDPSGFLEISDENVVYFDPMLPTRIEGLVALRAYYEPLRERYTRSIRIAQPTRATRG